MGEWNLTDAERLRAAADIIETPGIWVNDGTAFGIVDVFASEYATRCCMLGAVELAYADSDEGVPRYVTDAIRNLFAPGTDVTKWNDAQNSPALPAAKLRMAANNLEEAA